MNNIKDEIIKDTLRKFQSEKVMTIEQIAEILEDQFLVHVIA